MCTLESLTFLTSSTSWITYLIGVYPFVSPPFISMYSRLGYGFGCGVVVTVCSGVMAVWVGAGALNDWDNCCGRCKRRGERGCVGGERIGNFFVNFIPKRDKGETIVRVPVQV